MNDKLGFARRMTLGAYMNFTDRIMIADYTDINEQLINEIANNRKIKCIQISDYLPNETYKIIDNILSMRKDLTFRLFYFIDHNKVDISFLLKMPHLKRLLIDCIDFKS